MSSDNEEWLRGLTSKGFGARPGAPSDFSSLEKKLFQALYDPNRKRQKSDYDESLIDLVTRRQSEITDTNITQVSVLDDSENEDQGTQTVDDHVQGGADEDDAQQGHHRAREQERRQEALELFVKGVNNNDEPESRFNGNVDESLETSSPTEIPAEPDLAIRASGQKKDERATFLDGQRNHRQSPFLNITGDIGSVKGRRRRSRKSSGDLNEAAKKPDSEPVRNVVQKKQNLLGERTIKDGPQPANRDQERSKLLTMKSSENADEDRPPILTPQTNGADIIAKYVDEICQEHQMSNADSEQINNIQLFRDLAVSELRRLADMIDASRMLDRELRYTKNKRRSLMARLVDVWQERREVDLEIENLSKRIESAARLEDIRQPVVVQATGADPLAYGKLATVLAPEWGAKERLDFLIAKMQ